MESMCIDTWDVANQNTPIPTNTLILFNIISRRGRLREKCRCLFLWSRLGLALNIFYS
jgi:hypothetical protein